MCKSGFSVTRQAVVAVVVVLLVPLVAVDHARAALQIYWPLETGGGTTAFDSSGNGRDGTLTSMPAAPWVTDVPPQLSSTSDYSLEFAGSNDRVVTSSWKGVTGTNPRTMSAWIKTNDNQGTIMAWGKNTGSQKWVFRTDGERLRVEVNGGWARGTADVRDNTWHHVAATWENDGTPNVKDVKFYVDGVFDPISASRSKAVNTKATINFKLGTAENNSKDFTGFIDDAAVWDQVLTLQQIRGLAAGGSPTALIPEPSTLLVWSLLAGLGIGLGWWRRKR